MTNALDELIATLTKGLEELTRETLREHGCILYRGPHDPDEEKAAEEYAEQWVENASPTLLQGTDALAAQQGFIAGCDWVRNRMGTHRSDDPCWCGELQTLGCNHNLAQIVCDVMRREYLAADSRVRKAEGELSAERHGAQRQDERTDAAMYYRLARALRHLMIVQEFSLHMEDNELTARYRNEPWTGSEFSGGSDTRAAFNTIQEILSKPEGQRFSVFDRQPRVPWHENEHFLTWYAHKMGWNSKDVRRLIRRAEDHYTEYLEQKAEIRGDDS